MEIVNDLQNVQGGQGHVYLIKWTDHQCPFNTTIDAVCKTSKFIDFVIESEAKILQKLSNTCLHFCPIYNLFFDKSVKMIIKDITVYCNRYTLGDVINYLIYHPNTVYNCMLQAIFSIPIYLEKGITHYDLHADNVMITNTPERVHIYSIDQEYFALKNFGILPVFIDFGMAYNEGERFDSSFEYVSHGFTPCMFDKFVDFRLLFSTTAMDIREMLKKFKASKYAPHLHIFEKYLKIVDRVSSSLDLRLNGWFKKNTFFNLHEYFLNLKPKILDKKKGLFKHKNFSIILNMVKHIITVPFSHASNNFLRTHMTKMCQEKFDKKDVLKKPHESVDVFIFTMLDFFIEWRKVEEKLRNTLHEKLFLKDLVYSIEFSMFENSMVLIQKVNTLRKKYPYVFNFFKLFHSIVDFGSAYFFLLEYFMFKIQKKKEQLYNSVNIVKILTSLPRTKITYEIGMKLFFVKENIQVIVDDSMIESLKCINNHHDENKILKDVLFNTQFGSINRPLSPIES
ncbi:MAG: hypothetical protein ACRC39_04360 [Enterobacter sp.]